MKLPRDVSGKEAVKALERAGFSVIRQRGSHVRLSKRGKNPVTVPVHKTIDPGTLASILRQAGITPEEFNRFL